MEDNKKTDKVQHDEAKNDIDKKEQELKEDKLEKDVKVADETSNNKDEEAKDEKIELEEKLKEADDRYKRLLAEFDNFRKRTEKESALMIDIGASMILTKILPIVDNFERALKTLPSEIKENSFEDGIDKIYKQILKTLEELDVKPIEAVGKPFDPNLHNAVLTDEESDAEVDTVTEELQKGYTYKEQVLRHSMVKVKK